VNRLIVLAPSHYCERARWSLDHAGVSFVEERWAPLLHVPLARRIAAKRTLPILVTGSEVIQGSDRILDWTGTGGGCPALERRFEQVIGPLVRRYMYAATLSDPASGIAGILFDGVPAWQRLMGRLCWPGTRRLMVNAMNARPHLVPEFEAQLGAELDWFDRELGDRAHLVGDSLGRADITAASLLSALVRPALFELYGRVRLPGRVEDTLGRWRDRPSLHWVRQLYEQHRCTNNPRR
jgi:glutathione S-transferase